MDKRILYDYIDACELIKETEAEIRKLRKKKKRLFERVYLAVIQSFHTIHNISK